MINENVVTQQNNLFILYNSSIAFPKIVIKKSMGKIAQILPRICTTGAIQIFRKFWKYSNERFEFNLVFRVLSIEKKNSHCLIRCGSRNDIFRWNRSWKCSYKNGQNAGKMAKLHVGTVLSIYVVPAPIFRPSLENACVDTRGICEL